MSRFHAHDWDFLPINAFRPRGGRALAMTLEGGGGSDAPPPDPRLVEAQMRNLGFQDQAIQQIMEINREMMPLQKEAMQFGLDTSRQAWQQAQADRAYSLERRGQLTGMQDRMINDVNNFDPEVKGDQYAAQAMADVSMQAQAARQEQARTLERRGISLRSGKLAGMSNEIGLSEAAAKVGVANKVREAARMEGYGLTDRATNALAGYPAMGLQTTGSGAQFGAGNAAIANQGAAGLTSGWNTVGNVAGQAGQNATNMWNSQANFKTQQDNIEGEKWGAFIGAGATLGAAMISDRRLKKDIVLLRTDEATGFNLYEFSYLWSDERIQGFMADEVQRTRPDAVFTMDNGFLAINTSVLSAPAVEA